MRRIPRRPGFTLLTPIVALALSAAATAWMAGAGTARAAEAFDPVSVLPSVVSVLPVWPGYGNAPASRRGPTKEPEGTGVAIRQGGYVITALHIVGRATSISVRLSDGRILPARIAGKDPMTDLAILKVDAELPVLAAGPAPKMGDRACAIGNQFGLGLAFTCGVVSATGRSGVGFNRIEDFVQTDAPVNPGASGGPLLNAKGRLIGIVSAIFTKNSDANIGVNFAASMELVSRVTDDMIAHGRVVRGVLGVRLSPLDRATRARTAGVRVSSVTPNSAAARAGLKPGDIVTAVNGRRVFSADAAITAIHMRRPGETLAIRVDRNGTAHGITAKLTRANPAGGTKNLP